MDLKGHTHTHTHMECVRVHVRVRVCALRVQRCCCKPRLTAAVVHTEVAVMNGQWTNSLGLVDSRGHIILSPARARAHTHTHTHTRVQVLLKCI